MSSMRLEVALWLSGIVSFSLIHGETAVIKDC